jgi:hypothetical protein
VEVEKEEAATEIGGAMETESEAAVAFCREREWGNENLMCCGAKPSPESVPSGGRLGNERFPCSGGLRRSAGNAFHPVMKSLQYVREVHNGAGNVRQ